MARIGLGLVGTTSGLGGFFAQSLVGYLSVVEKVWRNLWVSLWENCGKVLNGVWESLFSTKIVAKVEVFHVVVEKFCRWICTWFDRGRGGFCTVSTALTITTIKNIIEGR